ncbi:methionine-tRNA ligase, beta subunit [Kwoniella dejecticola CBS 10117]|uniref:Methionine-tRNA ligase, beta subunit n=1 Tax=Kwoniella dejecticola CBS 10117 TaxID=1296121 RepID=A0A1A5ZUU3_9TREE|nr:methionine-tRNA ligase, beta subunit [Kwoniella dejecticola CBS 10117]OBR81578.1 methionine-tRNA ligase, beta subunit [Kwoniella dejecticola CBS 10117]
MSTVSDFVKAAERADPTLAGSSDKDKAEIAKLSNETEGYVKDLSALNEKLTPLTYLYSNAPSSADISLYAHLHPSLINAPPTQHPEKPSLLRYFLQIQSLDSVKSAQKELPNSFPSLDIDLSSLPVPERKAPPPKVKKDKKAAPAPAAGVAETVTNAVNAAASSASAAVSAATETAVNAASAVKDAVVGGSPSAPVEGGKGNGNGQKKEKKEKKEKAPKAPAVKEEPTGPLPSMIDMRVGRVLDVKRHPDADSLYVESIDVGEEEPRTVCSGLVKYMSEDQIRGATIVVICNLKPVTMRGVKSFAMLLCASSKDGKDAPGGIEFVLPPEGSQPGERIYFEGEKYENAKPEAQLNPKKKIFETIQPGFTTLETREAAWIDPETKTVHKIRTKDGVLKAGTLVGASLS